MKTRLVVNADDYGYFGCVSSGILEAARLGTVRATGVLANSPRFDEHVRQLATVPSLDVGVHLTLTFGRPLTEQASRALARWGGAFPTSAAQVAMAVFSGQLPLEVVADEWNAQVCRCLDAGLEIRFLNTHEHVHLLPLLGGLVTHIARERNIHYVRDLRPEWAGTNGISAVVRNALFLIPALISRWRSALSQPLLLGVGVSGKLDLPYLESTLTSLRPGGVYELMCHPGRLDPAEIRDPRLLSYHRWEMELSALTSERFRTCCEANGIHLSGFRDLTPNFGPPLSRPGGEQK